MMLFHAWRPRLNTSNQDTVPEARFAYNGQCGRLNTALFAVSPAVYACITG